jgi:hypothetical protein
LSIGFSVLGFLSALFLIKKVLQNMYGGLLVDQCFLFAAFHACRAQAGFGAFGAVTLVDIN